MYTVYWILMQITLKVTTLQDVCYTNACCWTARFWARSLTLSPPRVLYQSWPCALIPTFKAGICEEKNSVCSNGYVIIIKASSSKLNQPDSWTTTSHRPLDFSSDQSEGHLTSFHFAFLQKANCAKWMFNTVWKVCSMKYSLSLCCSAMRATFLS